MKKTLRILSIILTLILLASVLSSCAKTLSGTYSGELGLGSLAGAKGSYTFSGSKVTLTITTTLLGNSTTTEYKGTYEIAEATDGTKCITFTFEDDDASAYTGTKSFSEGTEEDGTKTVTIGGITYTKQ